MRIDIGNFGNVVPGTSPGIDTPSAAFGGAVAQGGGAVGGALQGLGAEMARQKEVQQRADAALNLAKYTNDAADAHDQIQRDVQAGSVPAADALSAYQAKLGDLRTQYFEGMPDDQLRAIAPSIETTNGRLSRSLTEFAVKHQQSEIATQLDGLGEQFQRQAARDLPGAIANYSSAVDALGPQAGLSPQKIGQIKQKFVENTSANVTNLALSGFAATGNLEGIQDTRKRLEGPEGDVLDPTKRTALITKAYGYENHIIAQRERDAQKADSEQRARDVQGQTAYNQMYDLWANGRFMSPDAMSAAADAAAGTASEKPLQELFKRQSQVAGFASQPLSIQRNQLEQMRAAGSTAGVGMSPDDLKQYQQLDKIYTAGVQAYKENPWQAAQERGVISDLQTISLGDIQTAKTVIAERMKQIGVIEDKAGRRVSPLQPQEASDLLRLVSALPLDARAQALNVIGGAIGVAGRISDLASQWKDRDEAMSLALKAGAGGGNGNPLKSVSGTPVSAFILSGAQAIKDKTVKVDDIAGSGLHSQIATKINGVLPGEQEEDAKRMAYYIAVGSAARNGRAAPNSTDIQDGINAATGGITNTGGTRFNGEPNRVAMPYGWTESQFTSSLKAAGVGNIENTVNGAPIGAVYVGRDEISAADFMKKFASYKLVRVGVRGTYAVQAGQQFVSDVMGRPVTVHLDLGQQPATSASAAAATQVDNPFGG